MALLPQRGALEGDSGNLSFVGAETRRHDQDRFLCALFAPPEHREHLWTLYAVNAEIARIRDGVSEPMLGHLKVQWWRDVVANIAANQGAPAGYPIAEALQRVMAGGRFTSVWFEDILIARDWELDDGVFPTLASLEEHVERTAVRLAWLSLDVLGITDTISRDAVRHAAMGFALCGMLRAIPFHAARNRLLMPSDLLDSAAVTLGGIQSGQAMTALTGVAAKVASRAYMHLDLARAVSRMADRQSRAVLLWATIARSFCRALERADYNVFDRRILGFRAGVAPLIWASWRRRY